MLQRLTRYATALIVLGSACAVYQFAFVAWLEPDPLPTLELAQTPGLRRNHSLSTLFPPDAWQLQHCKRLQTRDGVLLFEHWEQIGDDQWKLWPLSLVMGLNSDSPLLLDAPEGAEIKFSESLDMMSGGAPPIERGRMIGEVRIKSVGKAISLGDPKADGAAAPEGHLEIVSSDFGIDFQKIWTTQPIEVRLGDVKLLGRDLTLHLAPISRLGSSGDGILSILERMELIYLHQLTVPLPEGGLWGNKVNQTASATNAAAAATQRAQRLPTPGQPAEPPARIDLRCAGRVVFLFGTNELMLNRNVHLEHRTRYVTDVFECNDLTLQFADLLRTRYRGEAGEREDEIGDYLVSVVAEGFPARLRLPSFTTEIAAETIALDARLGRLRMSGSAGARITYASHTWLFEQFTYQFNPSDPMEIGVFDASGSGLVEFSGQADLPVKRLRWTEGVKLEQPDASGEFALRLDGNVTALMSDDGEFACDSALLVLQAGDRKLAGDEWLQATRPKRFQATGRVHIESPMVNIATKLLQVYFDFDPEAIRPAGTAAQGDTPPLASSPMRQWVRQPTGSGEPSSGAATPVASSTPVQAHRPTILGETINAKLRLSGKQLTATDLSVSGNVSVRHTLKTPSGELPAVLTGDRLQLRDTLGDEILQIGSGIDRPARLSLGDGHFVGPLIQVRLADNIVWIKDAGEFQVPTQLLPSSGGGDTNLQPFRMPVASQQVSTSTSKETKLRWITPPHCRWRGQMLFDGNRAVLTDGVEIRGTVMAGDQEEIWDIDVVGDQLAVVMEQEVQMRQLETVRTAAIDHISLTATPSHPLVITVNQLTSEGIRKARHVLTTPELTLRPQTSMITGSGPGWYRAWVKTENKPMGAAVTSGGFRSDDSSMVGVHLVYQEKLEANLTEQCLDFFRGVRIAGRPVKSWDEAVDVEAMQGLRLGESTMDCDRLRLAIDTTQPRHLVANAWEMEAIGGVLFQTRNEKGLYSGNAGRATYTAAKDLFVIQGDPGRSATMNQTLPTGAPGWSVAGNGSVNTRTMEVNFEFSRLQLGPLPNLSR